MQIVELKVNVEKSQLEALAAEVEKLNGKVINFKTSTGGTGGSSPTAGINKGLKETSQQAEKTGQSIMSVVGKVAKWTAVTTAVYAPVKAFKEALGTLKEVDSQLVQVQKVTNFSQRQMKEIEQQAYKTASAYGVSADKYTESVAAFARAGYKEQSAGLAELSTKTQLVGDTTAEVANQFLLSTDAAYKYNGSVQQLSRVLDGANQLDNNYATSIEKIAEGMGLVAPVAAQAGIGVDELMASLGTITAVTQRSGAEAARAYRALVLNILGDTKTEIADGATWTAGEIEGLRDVLRTYAPEAVKAAEATGDIINPMKAMEGLSQAMKDGVLTEQKLMEMVSDIGGKLRTSQLLALIQNWDMYESMLSDFQNAAGSADKEVENAMNSWERKTEVLKNTWTEFVSHMVDTDLIKGGLDGVTKVVEVLDSDFGQAAIKVAGITAAFAGLAKVVGVIAGSAGIAKIAEFFAFIAEFGAGETILASFSGLAAAMGPLLPILAGIAAAVTAGKLYDFFHIDYSEQADKVKDLKSEYEELYGTQSEYQQLIDKQTSGGGLDQYEQNRLDYLKNYQKELQATIEAEKELAKQKFDEEYGSKSKQRDLSTIGSLHERNETGAKIESKDVVMARDLAKAFKELNSEFESGAKGESEYKASIKDLMDQYEDFVSLTREGLDEGWLDYGDLTDAQKQILDLYDALERLYSMDGKELRIEAALDSFEQAGDGVTQFANQVVVDGAKMRQAFMDAGLSAEDANRTIQELRDGGAIVIDVENDGIDQTLGYLEELGVAKQDVEGNWNIDFGDVQNLAKELGMSADEATTLAAELSKLNGVNVTGAVESTDRIATSVKELMNGAPYTFDMNAIDNASGTVEGVKTEIESTPETHDTVFNGDASGVTGAASTADGAVTGVHKTWNTSFLGSPRDVVNKSGTAKSAVSTVPRSWSTTFSGNTGPIAAAVSRAKALIASLGSGVGPGGGKAGSGNAGLHKATGDLHFRGGPVLLGDELSPDGSPRPELVITKNGAFIAGMAGPVMTSLPAGSRIFKYSDTLDVFSGGDMTRLQAFAGGSGVHGLSLSEIRARGQSSGSSASSASSSASKPSTSSGSSRSSSGSSGSRSSGSSRSGGRSGGRSDGSSGSSGGGGSSVDTLKEELELLEAQYSYLEASNASTEELHNKSKEIQAKLHQINDTLRSTGGKEKDIVDNSTKWWQETEKQRQLLEEDVSLLEAQYSFMEESGASAEDLNAKSAEIQAKLHEINELARATGASEEDILKTSQKWWAELKKIHEVQRDVYQNERNLLQSEADLMEHQNKSAGERIAKLRQIQDSLHQEAEYMRSIKASQAEINQLSIQWWEIESNILAIQQDLVDQLNSAISARLDQVGDQKDDAIDRLRDDIDALERERDARIASELGEKKAWIEEEEKAIKAIRREQEIAKENQAIADAETDIQEKKVKLLEAEKNLRNAMRQRTVRFYNAKTGQWEWGADARNVKQAQEEYDRAKKDAEDAEANLPKLIEDTELSRRERILNETKDSVQDVEDAINKEYDGLIKAVEDEIDVLTRGFDDLRNEWDDLYQKIFGTSTENIEKILQQMLEQGLITPEQAAEIRAFWDKINGFAASIDDTTKKILAVVQTFADAKAQNPNMTFAQYLEGLEEEGVVIDTSGFSPGLVNYIENNPSSGWIATGENGVSVDSEGTVYISGSSGGSNTHRTENEPAKAVHVGGNTPQGLPSSGYVAPTLDSITNNAYANDSGSSTSSSSSSGSSGSSSRSTEDKINDLVDNGFMTADSPLAKALRKNGGKLGTHDSGGILNGFGGIKATARDEIVIPPGLAEYMLKPSANKTFQNRVAELSLLYGAKPIPGTLSNNHSSNDHYGDTYTFGNVTLTEDKAKNTTVYELAQMSRSLGIYRNG